MAATLTPAPASSLRPPESSGGAFNNGDGGLGDILQYVAMESEMPAGGSGSRQARTAKMLGKRERSQPLMPRMPSMASLPSMAKQGRRSAVGKPPRVSPSSLPPAVAAGVATTREGARELARGETMTFLKACGICGRRLGPGKDTYIYRGEAAFCSKECREVRIESDECVEKNCSLTSIKEAPLSSDIDASDPSGGSSGVETVATV